MEKAKIKTRYDPSVDVFYMLFKEGPSHELVDAGPDIIIELDENGEIMGIEIWNARKNGVIEDILNSLKGSEVHVK